MLEGHCGALHLSLQHTQFFFFLTNKFLIFKDLILNKIKMSNYQEKKSSLCSCAHRISYPHKNTQLKKKVQYLLYGELIFKSQLRDNYIYL